MRVFESRAAAIVLSLSSLLGCGSANEGPAMEDTPSPENAHRSEGGGADGGEVPPVDVKPSPTNLRVYVGGKDIALIWDVMAGGTKYTIYRDGVAIGTALPRPGEYRFSGNATFIDPNVVDGTKYTYEVEATLADGTTSARSPAASATHSAKGTPVPTITLDSSYDRSLQSYLEKGKVFLETWYPKIANALATPEYQAPTRFTMKIGAPCGAAVTDGTTITVCQDFAVGLPDDVSIFGHESTHVLQIYGDFSVPGVVEGIAAWGGDFATGYVQPKPAPGASYSEGYGTAEYFFEWIGRTYKQPEFARAVNLAAHAGSLNDAFFVARTGRTLGQLWTELSGERTSSPLPIKGPGGKCADLSYNDSTDGTPIQLLACRTTDAQTYLAVASLSDPAAVTLRVAGKCLTDASLAVQIKKCDPADASQAWKVQNGTVLNVSSNKCLQPSSGRTADGTRLVLAPCNGSASQKWTAPVIAP